MALRAAFIMLLLLPATPFQVAAAPSLSEAAGRYVIVASGSRLAFTVSAVSGPGINAQFARFDGTIDIPASSVERARVTITIYPDSVTSGEKRIDDFLKSNAVFDTQNEQAITFHSTRVGRTGEDTAIIEGNLTARGRTFRETFSATLTEAQRGGLRFHVRGQVFRSRYGMDVGTPLYSNVVDFDMDLSSQRR